jgi:hypothetical protein
MKIAILISRILFIAFLFFLTTIIFKHPHKEFYHKKDAHVYSSGNAPDSTRKKILQVLEYLQEGYINRDVTVLTSFMENLFSTKNILILGTMPNEIYAGFNEAESLIRSDWESWGDCTFFFENANISVYNKVAWFSTFGHVKFDLTSLLDLPFRLSGIMVNENDSWKIQQLQFQFDLDLSYQLLLILLLMIWFLISLVRLAFLFIKNPTMKLD